MANGTHGSPCFWLPLQNAGVLETTTKQGTVVVMGLLDCTMFIFLHYLHRSLLYLLLHCPPSSQRQGIEEPEANTDTKPW